jgi:alpha/beta superfamily hydrolase
MQNKVVHTLARAMHELGTPTVRFNFRGVGGSAGAYADGEGELQDALAVVAWARRRWRSERLWLAGFSFGAAVALHAAGTARPERLVTVAPPVSRLQAIPASRPGCRWLVVHGDRDELVPVAAVESWVTGFEPPPELQILAGAEHFFHGRLGDLREVVRGFLAGPVND